MSNDRTQNLFRKFYGGRSESADGTKQFHELCRRHTLANSLILEIGAGPSNETSRFLASLGTLSGVDVSEEVLANDALQHAYVYDGHKLPFANGTVDVCFSNYVLEHIADPSAHFREVERVLKSDGKYIFRTPNLYHYVALFSRILPHAVHVAIANRMRGLDADAHDPWPTVYRANTKGTIERLAEGASLRLESATLIEPVPYYGRASVLLFYPMMLYERFVNSTPLLESARANILAVLCKP